MQRVSLLLAVLALVRAPQAQGRVGSTKGVYGTDDRTDESRAAECVGETCTGSISAELRSVGSGSTVTLVQRNKLFYHAGTNSWAPISPVTLGQSQRMCDTDEATGAAPRFSDQPVPGSCSGTVVQWDPDTGTGLVATAGHCFDEDDTINGCQTARGGGLHPLPPRTTLCQFTNDNECDDGLDGGTAFCPVGTDEDCPSRPVEASTCPYLFVFDFTDETLLAPPPPELCQYSVDGECDADGAVCPEGSDTCDCLGTHCLSSFSIPAANVYDCAEVVMCDVENLANTNTEPADWLVNGHDGHFTDYALVRIVAAGISSVTATCSYEQDGECDVPTYCPEGTDTVDCNSQDTDELRAARTTDYSALTRALLDAGSPRVIRPATLFSGVLAQGTSLTVIGHPSGLPRKYTGGATVQHIAACQLQTVCADVPTASWAAYVADVDTFAGNSGSGKMDATCLAARVASKSSCSCRLPRLRYLLLSSAPQVLTEWIALYSSCHHTRYIYI